MSKRDNDSTAGWEHSDGADDPRYSLLLELMLEQELLAIAENIDPQVLDQDDEDEQAVLDRAALKAKIAELRKSAASKADQTTRRAAPRAAETVAEGDSALAAGALPEELLEMVKDVDAYKQKEELQFIAGYRKMAVLGEGGQGTVYLIEGKDDFSAASALKVFDPAAYGDRVSFLQDMRRMRTVAQFIHRHAQSDVVMIDWTGRHDNVFCMRMECIHGFDLRYLLRRERLDGLEECVSAERWKALNDVIYSKNGTEQLAVRPAIAVYIVEHVLRGLAMLHSKGIVHGDIKPSNIMLTASGGIKIIDIGSAFELMNPPQRHHYTPAYAAPEFLESETMTTQSDITSAGLMLIEMLSGKSITNAASADKSTKTLSEKDREDLLDLKRRLWEKEYLKSILPERVGASDHLVELCRRLIAPDLSQRFQTATECIVHPKGTFEFSNEISRGDLGVCAFHEISQWIANIDAKEMSSSRQSGNAAAVGK